MATRRYRPAHKAHGGLNVPSGTPRSRQAPVQSPRTQPPRPAPARSQQVRAEQVRATRQAGGAHKVRAARQARVTDRRVRASRRVPTVTQVSQTECGLCSCLSLLQFHGRWEDLHAVRNDLEAGRDGLSATQLARFLRSRGLDARLFRVRGVAGLRQFAGPVILYWEDYHFLVLERFDGRKATVMDPAVGRRQLTASELAEGFSGIAISATPGPGFQRLRKPAMVEWKNIPLFSDGSRKRIAIVGLLSIAGYAAVLGIPELTQWAVDKYQRWQGLSDAVLMIAMILGAAVVFFAIQLIRIIVLSTVVAFLGAHLMTQTFGKLLSLPYRYFTTRQPGELLFRLGSVNSVRDMLSSQVAQGVLDIGTLLIVTVYLLVLEWHLGLVAVVLFAFNAAYLVKTRTRVLEAVESEISNLSKSQSTQLDAIVSIPTIKMGGYAREFVTSWAKTYIASLGAMTKRMRLQSGWINGVTTTVQTFGPLVLLLAALYFVNHGQISMGDAIAAQALSATYFALASSVFRTYTEITEASRHMTRLGDIMATPSEHRGGPMWRLPTASIRLADVSFRHTRHSNFVVHNVSLDIPAGAKIALVGQSGSGKSTLGRIICGLYEPTWGAVEFGGRDAREYDREALRRHIGYVPQEVHLHNRTILENLTMGRDIPEDAVLRFCAEVGILDFVEELPMGLRTLVSEMGTNFSGGQRQRLAIVRALLQRPAIYVLDEATASLDTVNERRVTQMIEQTGATQVIIAHRLATIRNADYIYVFDGGRLVEHGTHTSLMSLGHVYSRLYAETSANSPIGGAAS
jgi:ABC-type bacteriocin/lantibiotic exporter with double-glycine peptidase domain